MKKIILSAIVALALIPQAEAGKPSRQKRGNSEFIAAVVVTPEGNMEVWLNTRETWEKEMRLTDSYVEDGQMERADAITDQTSLCNLMESTYEPCEAGSEGARSQKQIMRDLEAVGVEIEPEFQAWAQHEVES